MCKPEEEDQENKLKINICIYIVISLFINTNLKVIWQTVCFLMWSFAFINQQNNEVILVIRRSKQVYGFSVT